MPWVLSEQKREIYDCENFTIHCQGWVQKGMDTAMCMERDVFSVYIKKLNLTVKVEGCRSQHRARQMCLDIGELFSP